MKSNEELLSELKKELNRIGSTNRSEYDLLKNNDQVFSSTISRRLNLTWREIIEKIGLKPERALLPRDAMLNELKAEFERLGSFTKAVYKEKRDKTRFPYPAILTKHLDMSWAEITMLCGRKEPVMFVADNVSDEDLINEYKALSKELGTPATIRELTSNTIYTYEIYRQHFGTIGELRQACGFQVKTKRAKPIITKEDCERELKTIYKKHGRVSFNELKNLSTISLSTFFRKFHTTKISEIWDEVLSDKKA